MSRKILRRVGVGILVLAVVAGGLLFAIGYFSPIEYTGTRDLSAQVTNLEKMVEILEPPAGSEQELLRLRISEAGLQELSAALVGTEVELPAASKTRISLSSLSLDTTPGELRLDIALTGSSPKFPGELVLAGTGVVLFSHFERPVSDGASALIAVYKIQIERMVPRLGFSWLSFRTREWANELIRSKAIEEFGEALQFKIPVLLPPDIELGFLREDTTFIEDTGANYVVRSELPVAKIAWPLSFRIPVPTGNGLVFIAADGSPSASGGAPVQISNADLAVRREMLLEKVRILVERYPSTTSGLEISIHRGLFERLVDQVNALPEPVRTIRYQLASWRGRLVDEIHDADIVGKGGYYVEFDDQSSASGSVKFGQLTSAWGVSGFALSTRLRAEVDSRVNVYVDPYIGGGFDFDMGIEGDAEIPVSVTLDARTVSSGESRGVVLGSVVQCAQFPITVQGGGSVKFGVQMYELVGEDPSPLSVLFTNETRRYPLLEEVSTGSLKHSASYLEMTLVPLDVSVAHDAYVIRADIHLVRKAGVVPSEIANANVEAVTKALQEKWIEDVTPKCPAKSASKFLFAGQDFGPNNEFVKALARIGRAAELAKHNTEVAWSDVEDVVKDPASAPKKAAEIAKRTIKEVDRVVERIDRDIAKPIRKFVKRLRF